MSAVDPETLQRLHSDVGGDGAIVANLLETFRSRAAELVAAIATSSGEGDVEGWQRSAHDLKSISALVGATAIRDLALAMEIQESDDQTRVIAAADALEPLLQRTLNELHEISNKL